MKEDINELLTLSEEFDPISQISKAMKLRKLNQKQLAEKINVKPSTVSMWLAKSNNITLTDFIKIVTVLDMPYEYFFKTRSESFQSEDEDLKSIYSHIENIEKLFSDYSLRRGLSKKDELVMKTSIHFMVNFLKDLESENNE